VVGADHYELTATDLNGQAVVPMTLVELATFAQKLPATVTNYTWSVRVVGPQWPISHEGPNASEKAATSTANFATDGAATAVSATVVAFNACVPRGTPRVITWPVVPGADSYLIEAHGLGCPTPTFPLTGCVAEPTVMVAQTDHPATVSSGTEQHEFGPEFGTTMTNGEAGVSVTVRALAITSTQKYQGVLLPWSATPMLLAAKLPQTFTPAFNATIDQQPDGNADFHFESWGSWQHFIRFQLFDDENCQNNIKDLQDNAVGEQVNVHVNLGTIHEDMHTYSWRASNAQHVLCSGSIWASGPCQKLNVVGWANNPANPQNQPPKLAPQAPAKVGNAGSVGGTSTVLMVHTKVPDATEYHYEFWVVNPADQTPLSSPATVTHTSIELQQAMNSFWAQYVGGVQPTNGYVFEMVGGDFTLEYGWHVKACNSHGCGPNSNDSFWQQTFPWDAVWSYLGSQPASP
jgi:hypothetical protein